MSDTKKKDQKQEAHNFTFTQQRTYGEINYWAPHWEGGYASYHKLMQAFVAEHPVGVPVLILSKEENGTRYTVGIATTEATTLHELFDKPWLALPTAWAMETTNLTLVLRVTRGSCRPTKKEWVGLYELRKALQRVGVFMNEVMFVNGEKSYFCSSDRRFCHDRNLEPVVYPLDMSHRYIRKGQDALSEQDKSKAVEMGNHAENLPLAEIEALLDDYGKQVAFRLRMMDALVEAWYNQEWELEKAQREARKRKRAEAAAAATAVSGDGQATEVPEIATS